MHAYCTGTLFLLKAPTYIFSTYPGAAGQGHTGHRAREDRAVPLQCALDVGCGERAEPLHRPVLRLQDPARARHHCWPEVGYRLEIWHNNNNDKFALLWGEAQKKIAYSYHRVTYSYPRVTVMTMSS